MILIDLLGKPIPFKSPRVYSRRSFNPLYKEKEQAQYHIEKQYAHAPITGPVSVDIIFYFDMPKAFSKKKQIACLQEEHFPTSKFDLDNLSKFYLDCIKGIVIQDDGLIVNLLARKRYSSYAHTTIKIEEVTHASQL
jgi:Holliday junction resolvase RusA-like endonuclease